MSENCKSLVLQDKSNIEIFLSPDLYTIWTSLGENLTLLLANNGCKPAWASVQSDQHVYYSLSGKYNSPTRS